jgi:hypothetical protein
MTDIHVCIGTPCFASSIHDRYMVSYLETERALHEQGIKVSRISLGTESLIPRGRNRLVHSYLASGATHYLQIDADIEWKPQAVLGMLQANKRVVACAYPIKHLEWEAAFEAYKRGDKRPERFATKLAINPLLEAKEQAVDNMCIRVRDAATGFLMCERNVFFEMMEHYPDLYYFSDVGPGSPEYGLPIFTLFDCQIVKEALWDNGPKLPRYLSEDYLFCRRWQDMGGEVWLYIGANLNHHGAMAYLGDISTAYMPKPEVDQTKGIIPISPEKT